MSTAKKVWSAGQQVAAADLNGNFEGNKVTVLAGETLDGTPVPVPVCILSDIYQQEYRSEMNFGDVSGNTQRSVKIIPRGAITSSSIKLLLNKQGSPTGNLTIEVQTDSAGSPSGTPVTNGTSNTVAMSGLSGSYVETAFAFASAFSLSAGTTYHIVLKRSDAVSGSNYVRCLGLGSSSDYASFVGKAYNGSTWSASNLMYVEMVPATGSSYTAWRSDANVVGLHWFHGFAITDAASAGNNVDVQTDGVISGLTGLAPRKKYYVSDTVGTLSTSVGTYEVGVGEALSETTLLIVRYTGEYIGSTGFNQTFGGVASCTGYFIAISGANRWHVSQSFSCNPWSAPVQAGANIRGGTGVQGTSFQDGSSSVNSSASCGVYEGAASCSSPNANTNWSGSGTMYFYR